MNDRFTEDAMIKLVFFEGEDAENQETIFEGPAGEWREAVGKKWNGFDKGDLFMINEDRMRIYQAVETADETGRIRDAVYFISFTDVNGSKLNYDNLKSE